ncbi:MAG: galactokinase [Candidatus Omnitrophota bacterium]
MIIARTPFRVTLGGGGTDLESYYARYGGFVLAAAINKYVYITINKRTIDNLIWLSYSKIETVERVEDIKHELIREALKFMKIKNGIEIHSITEVSSGTGLGSSGSFTVGLLNALHVYCRKHISRSELAELVCRIEIDMLHKPIGKQDQYIASVGGITCLEIDRSGKVKLSALELSQDAIDELERNLLFFYTGIKRDSAYVLDDQKKASEADNKDILNALCVIKDLGVEIKYALQRGNIDKFGRLLDEHWKVKKTMSRKISSSSIDECYEFAKRHGALGGKIMGAGGGGFFMFYLPGNKQKLRDALTRKGLREMRCRFDFEGSKIIANFF